MKQYLVMVVRVYFLMNQALPRKEIVCFPCDDIKKQFIEFVRNTDEYQNAIFFRHQLDIIVDYSKSFALPNKKITYEDLALIFNVTIDTIKYQIRRARDERKGKIQKNGHPFKMHEQDLELLKRWIDIHPYPPKFSIVKQFIQKTFKLSLCYRSLVHLFDRIGYKVERGEPLEKERYFVDTNLINYFYDNLFEFFQRYNVPSHFVFNLDEEGHDQFSDAIKEYVVVPKSHVGKVSYPVCRKNDHTTFLACISAGGDYLNPLIIVKRKTVDSKIFYVPINDKIMIKDSESGYINSEIYDDWMNSVFFPGLKERREKFSYEGPAVLLLDGCSSHLTQNMIQECDANNVKIWKIITF